MALASKSRWIGLVLCFAACSSTPGSADLTAWDQARVTAIAQQLAEASVGWEAAVLREPEAGPRLNQNARALHEQSATLAAHLAKGDGHDGTLDYYRGLRELADDTQEMLPQAAFAQLSLNAWTKVSDPLGRLAPYYER